MSENKALRWVKASERLPGMGIQVFAFEQEAPIYRGTLEINGEEPETIIFKYWGSRYVLSNKAERLKGIFWLEESSPSPSIHPEDRERVYRWVKASERLPGHGRLLYCKTTLDRKIVTSHVNGEWDDIDLNYEREETVSHWLEEVPAPIPQPVSKETESDVRCPNCLGEGTEVRSEFGPETCRCCGGLKNVNIDVWEEWTREYGGNPTPQPPIPETLPTEEIPAGYGIVYDKVFMPCKYEDCEGAVCDFDDDQQCWASGGYFVRSVKGPVAVIPAKHYEAIQASLSSIKAELLKNEAEFLQMHADFMTVTADKALYRKESEMYQARYSELSEEIGKRNVEVAELKEWISVEDKDRLPEIGEFVLIYNTEGAILVGRRFTEDWVAFFADGENKMGELTATHWKPLPEGPNK